MRFAMAGLAVCALAVMPAVAAKHDSSLVVPLKTSAGEDAGTARFENKAGKLRLTLELKNVASGDHGVHIHQKPLCEAPDFKTAGGHFNPDMKQHGTENPMGPHAGDLPKNLTFSPDKPKQTFTLTTLTMGTGAANDILANGGTSIIVHEKADDMKTDPSGNSGNRIACGVIAAPAPAAQ